MLNRSKVINITLLTIASVVFTFLIATNHHKVIKTPIEIIPNPLCHKIYSFIENSNKRIPSTMIQVITDEIILLVEPDEIPLVVSIIQVESNFNPTLVSHRNARGLMQVRYSVWKELLRDDLGINDQFDLHEASIGIQAGLYVLHTYITKEKGDIYKALYRYSGKSKTYPDKILKSMDSFSIY